MKQILLAAAIAAAIMPTAAVADEVTPMLPAAHQEMAMPSYFKDSFLDLADDVSEAAEEDRQLMIYFHQEGCPYCLNMIEKNFKDPQLSQFIQKRFDVIELNIWGDREVTLPDGSTFSEKQLAAEWKVQYTPTLVFFDKAAEIQLRIDGYRPPETFAKILDYVVTGEQGSGIAQKLLSSAATGQLPERPVGSEQASLQIADQPLAVLIETPGCLSCDELHNNVFADQAVTSLMDQFKLVRVNAASDNALTLPDGSTQPANAWVSSLGLNYYPSTLFFNKEGVEVFRIDSYVRKFHYQRALEFVSGEHYLKQPEFQRFISDRAREIRESGETVELLQ